MYDQLKPLLKKAVSNPLMLAPLTKILDRDSNLIVYDPTDAQREIVRDVIKHRWVMINKARQLGSTTANVFLLTSWAILRPNYRVLIVAQTERTAVKIGQMVKRFVENYPQALVPEWTSNTTTVTFASGSAIEVMTATSASSRGSTYNAILATEVAFWPRPEESARALFQSLSGGDTVMILESTPNGINGWHALWNNPQLGLHKKFVSWLMEPSYVSDQTEYAPSEQLMEYGKEYGLTEPQLRWAAQHLSTKCLGSWPTFLQECAVDPTTCFLRSGDAFFDNRPEWDLAEFSSGLLTLHEPKKNRTYAVGVDTASGSSSEYADYSAAVVLDVTVPNKLVIAATLIAKETPEVWAQSVLALCRRYSKPEGVRVLANVERTGGWGNPVITTLRRNKVTVYRQRRADPVKGVNFSNHWGWDTNAETRGQILSKLQGEVNSGRLQLTCPRLQYQAARYAYIKGRPDHPEGEHDDALFALALALAVDAPARQEGAPTALAFPGSHQEIIQLEARTGKSYANLKAEGAFDSEASYVGDDDGWSSGW